MQELRLLLYPFAVLYDGITSLRNWAFDQGIWKQKQFDVHIIAVGNLSTGGTGKTPMIEYLVGRNLDKKIAVLSRGYGRNTTGFIELSENDSPKTVGDEPLQIKLKYGDAIISAVCENRVVGITKLQEKHELDLILLDDAFQHRHVKASTYVLLTNYDRIYVDDFLLPAGNLRESSRGANRADVIIVTKCPKDISESEMDQIKNKIKPSLNQKLYFSFIEYGEYLISESDRLPLTSVGENDVTIVSGIAKSVPFVNFMRNYVNGSHLKFRDHHNFSLKEIENLRAKKFLITTEKDYMRLKAYQISNLYYLPITTKFIGEVPDL